MRPDHPEFSPGNREYPAGKVTLTPFTVDRSPIRETVRRILNAALKAVDPAQAVQRFVHRTEGCLTVHSASWNLSTFRRVRLLAIGKAAEPMAQATAEILGEYLHDGLMIVKSGSRSDQPISPKIACLESSHPIPDERSVQTGERICEFLRESTSEDFYFILLSGGASALATLPAQGVSLTDIQYLTQLLLRCGADIRQINTLRKHLDRLKGGGIARLLYPAQAVCLVLSDVLGDPLDVIASGPAVADPSTYANAWEILRQYDLEREIPESVRQILRNGMNGHLPETPKPGDALFEKVFTTVIGSNRIAAEAARQQAQEEGFHTAILTTFLQGEASVAGQFLAAIAREEVLHQSPLPLPACLICGGETTVTVKGEGKGGRNQELALGAVEGMDGLSALLVTLATDGGDGPTDAAGAVVSGETLSRARALGMSPADYLKRNDAYTFFEALGDLIKTGPTRTNVNDLAFVFVWKD
ncbi:glycerate kinase type-2 family protein [Anaerolinea thermophila]|uniref:Glycerate kinase n=1 Tax=Anaerolinea thermophila (strain DSM 14523 / JCM 11388 / NBRC 100420 / UNI-1) TaxID=926569 RepID=E8MZK1_ANATU|nr:glycerate kinase [Anaerolinea thermophila]BAJ64549.1 putative glycerate kinase [Anaerolinea thermophila UNI-1]